MPSSRADYFSKQSTEYALYRPGYPAELFGFLATLPARQRVALDCASGSGQAARGLAEYFDLVIAADASRAQLEAAELHGHVAKLAALSEELPIRSASVDLVACAQALHWFKLQAFYDEVRRVLCPHGILAVWTYGFLTVDPEIDALIRHFHNDILGPYWPAERWLVLDGYASLPFPFAGSTSKSFSMSVEWDAERLLGFLRTWSATQRYIDELGENPVDRIAEHLRTLWARGPKVKTIRWPLMLRYGTND